jgi:adenylate kinase
MKLVFLGPPGAGKGTQAALIANGNGIAHISTGHMFRSAISDKTPTGLKAQAFIEAGKLVPDEVTVQMVRERIAQRDCAGGFLLDGFPRSIAQAEALDAFAAPDLVIEIQVADGVVLKRLAGRRVCGACEGIFHMDTLADSTGGGADSADSAGCPVCEGTLIHRTDDQPETILRRLQVYHAQTEPLIVYYQKSGRLARVCGDQPAEDVHREILEALERVR